MTLVGLEFADQSVYVAGWLLVCRLDVIRHLIRILSVATRMWRLSSITFVGNQAFAALAACSLWMHHMDHAFLIVPSLPSELVHVDWFHAVVKGPRRPPRRNLCPVHRAAIVRVWTSSASWKVRCVLLQDSSGVTGRAATSACLWSAIWRWVHAG